MLLRAMVETDVLSTTTEASARQSPRPLFIQWGCSKPPRIDAKVGDIAPSGPALTKYVDERAITYIRMLDADAESADWREVTQIVLRIDAYSEPDRARRTFDTHLGACWGVKGRPAREQVSPLTWSAWSVPALTNVMRVAPIYGRSLGLSEEAATWGSGRQPRVIIPPITCPYY